MIITVYFLIFDVGDLNGIFSKFALKAFQSIKWPAIPGSTQWAWPRCNQCKRHRTNRRITPLIQRPITTQYSVANQIICYLARRQWAAVAIIIQRRKRIPFLRLFFYFIFLLLLFSNPSILYIRRDTILPQSPFFKTRSLARNGILGFVLFEHVLFLDL